MTSVPQFDEAWSMLDDQVSAGTLPGYAAAVRHGDEVTMRVGGSTALGGSDPMRPDTVFRIASLSKLLGGALVLRLARDSGVFELDSEVAEWLPELASPRVLRHPGAALADTVPAERQILVRDLLTFTFGLGFILEDCPLSRAMAERGLTPGPQSAQLDPDELMSRISAVPLAYQPGERWLYHTGADVVGVLVSRALRRPLSELLAEYVTGPLGMESTAFQVRDVGRMAWSYTPGPGGLTPDDPDRAGVSTPPVFESLGDGLVSTAEDYLGFLNAFRADSPVLDAESVQLMTTDSLSDGQRAGVEQLVGPGVSWGMCVAVDVARVLPWMRPGRVWWNGGSGTTACVDPGNDLAAVLLTQRKMTRATGDFDGFWRAMYSRLD